MPVISILLSLSLNAVAAPMLEWGGTSDQVFLPGPGDSDYCSVLESCPIGYGDCDSNSECSSGVCTNNVGAGFGFSSGTDVCWHPYGSWSYCAPEMPCAEGVGDCDSDADCAAGLECGQNRGAEYGWSSSFDVCVPGPGSWSYCSPSSPCGEGEGDCDSDADCGSGTVCTHDVGERFGWSTSLDVCLPPPGPAFDAELALRHAPVHYQDTDDSCADADMITAVDYDGNLVGTDNWENLFDGDRSGAAYYSVVETCTHWFVTYGFFHPRDWADGSFDQEHENDMEGLMLVVRKEDGGIYGELEAAVTVYHLDFYSYTAAGSTFTGGAEDIDGTISFQSHDGWMHPMTNQQAEGHGLKMWPYTSNFQGNSGQDGIIYFPTLGAGEVPSSGDDRDVAYRLIDFFEPGGVWEQQLVDADDSSPELFHHFGKMRGDEGGTCGDGWSVTCSTNAANLPWGWDDHDDGPFYGGDLGLDPAGLVDTYFSNLGSFSLDYVSNPYLEALADEGYSNSHRPDGMSSSTDLDALLGRLVSTCP